MKSVSVAAATRQNAEIFPNVSHRRFAKRRYAERIAMLVSFCFLLSVFGFQVSGQTYSIDWHKVSGGGGTSSNGQFVVSGTIGQHDASVAMNGGQYSVTGGFWSLISVVQTPGVPNLIIYPNGPNSVVVAWPNAGNYTLQQNDDLALADGWMDSGYFINTANGTNSIIITPPTGSLFFRLSNP